MPDAQKTILIIDDDPLVRELYSVKLKRWGFAVREAADGASGLSDALSFRPDLIVLDIIMSPMSGYDTIKKLRADKEWGAHVPVIVLTNDKLEKDADLQTIEATTPAYFLMKTDTTPEDMLSKIKTVLG